MTKRLTDHIKKSEYENKLYNYENNYGLDVGISVKNKSSELLVDNNLKKYIITK